MSSQIEAEDMVHKLADLKDRTEYSRPRELFKRWRPDRRLTTPRTVQTPKFGQKDSRTCELLFVQTGQKTHKQTHELVCCYLFRPDKRLTKPRSF